MANFVQEGKTIDYTPVSAVSAGALVMFAGLAGLAARTIAAGVLGALQVKGVIAVKKKDEAIVAGLPIWLDVNGDPKVGDAGTGAATSIGSGAMAADDILLGSAVANAAAADEFVSVDLNQFNPAFPAWANRLHVAKTTATIASADAGTVMRVATVDQTLTFPEIATVYVGQEGLIVNDCADGASVLTLTPNANDGFAGAGLTHAVNKTLTNTKATSKRGDFIHFLCAGDTMIQILEKRGIWARQA